MQLAGPPLAWPESQAQGPGRSAEHRPDIDGLRGLAVLSVFAVHSIPDAVHGGFIGVDIFFVISGYLICLLTLQAQGEGRFSLLGFYARRIKRIVPALLVVLLACLLFALTLAFPRQTREVGQHVAGGSAFVSNWVLWREAGYFDQSSEFKPLLHLWSLGIEEQFYLVWPVFALVLARWRQRAVVLILLALMGSFVLNLLFIESKPKGTFFLPPTRFWELLMGVCLAHCTYWMEGGPVAAATRLLGLPSRAQPALANSLAFAGAALLVLATLLIDKTDHFPGAWALLPTWGTVLLIAAGPLAWVNRRLLSTAVLQFYGRISFSLYLWHWPLLTFPLLLGYRPEWLDLMAILCVSVGLAFLTQRWIEAPARHSQRAPFTVPWLLSGLCLTGFAGWALSVSDGMLWRYPALVQPVAAAHAQDDYEHYRVGRCFLRSEQPALAWGADCVDPPAGGAALVWLWGDSHAAALYPGLRALQAQATQPWRLAQTTAALCPPLPGPQNRFSPHCAQTHERALELMAQQRPDTVILAGAWSLYNRPDDTTQAALEGLRLTVQRLRALGVRHVVVVGSLPQWRSPLPGLLLVRWRATGELPPSLTQGLAPGPLLMESGLRAAAAAAGAQFHSVLDQLCSDVGCQTATLEADAWVPLAFDESHLTVAGSRHVARRLMQAVAKASAATDPVKQPPP